MPAAVQQFFLSGHAIDLILGIMVVEAIVLLIYHRVTKRGVPVSDLIATMLSGAFLLLALRAVLVGWPFELLGLFIVAAFAAHLIDLRRRTKRA